MKNSAAISLIVGASILAIACLLGVGAFADSQMIDFSCIMLYQPVCYDCFILHAEDDDFTRQGGLGILDIEEMKLLSLILADPAAPHHDEIHAAFTTNSQLVRASIGSFLLSYTTPTATSGETARQPIPNTDPQLYYGADATLGAYISMGEWDLYIETMQAWEDGPFGGGTVTPTSDEGYVLLPEWLSMCSDVDGDGVSNCYEYWATSPRSWAGAVNPDVTDAAAVWNVWASPDAAPNTLKFAYNAATEQVYVMSGPELTWAEATGLAVIDYPGRAPISVSLVAIRNLQEHFFVDSLMEDGSYIWIGCTDAGRDIGHTAPNPDDWYWLSDPLQSQMTFTRWNYGSPNGVDGAEDCAIMRGSRDGGFAGGQAAVWLDVSEFTGAPPEPRRYPAIFELAGLYSDNDSDGVPDAFEDNDGDLVPDGFELTLSVVDFVGDPTSGDMPLEVQFTDLSVCNSGPITAWAWDFGDGATSTEQNPTHTYMAYEPSRTYTVSLTVTTEYGSDTRTKTAYITVHYACPFARQLTIQGAAFNHAVMRAQMIADELRTLLTMLGVSAWADWNIEGIENYPPTVPGDGLNDAVQMALIEYVVCNARLEASAGVFAGMTANKALFEADAAELSEIDSELAILGLFTDLFAGMIGSSPEMKTTVNELMLILTDGASGLPRLDDYVIFGGDAKTGPLFAGYGDLDGDGFSNEAEWDAVVAAGGGLETFLIVATDPDNFWPGNPLLPVAGMIGVGMLVSVLIATAGYVLRKKAGQQGA